MAVICVCCSQALFDAFKECCSQEGMSPTHAIRRYIHMLIADREA